MSKQWKRKLVKKLTKIVNGCKECSQAMKDVELEPNCTECISKARYELAQEILEELNA